MSTAMPPVIKPTEKLSFNYKLQHFMDFKVTFLDKSLMESLINSHHVADHHELNGVD